MIICIILWLVWLYIQKTVKTNEEKYNNNDLINTLSSALLVLNIILTLITIYNSVSTPPHYKEFKDSVQEVMELNTPVITDCKVSKNIVKIYVNQSYWSQLSTSEKVDTRQRIKVTIQTIAENSGYITNNKKVNVKFYNTGD